MAIGVYIDKLSTVLIIKFFENKGKLISYENTEFLDQIINITENENYETKYILYYYLNIFIDNLQFRRLRMDCNIYNIQTNHTYYSKKMAVR